VLTGATGAIASLLPPENATGNYVKLVWRPLVRIRLKQGEGGENLLSLRMSVEFKVWLKWRWRRIEVIGAEGSAFARFF
jgi:membrane fusion protein, multidrug efflux system